MTTTRTTPLAASGSTIEILADPTQTGGTVSIYRWRLAAAGAGPAPHFHTTFAETFVVEDGEVDCFDGRAWRTLHPGDTAHAPPGGVHAVRKQHALPATVLMALAPGVPREEYFARLADLAEPELTALHEVHDNHLVDQPGH